MSERIPVERGLVFWDCGVDRVHSRCYIHRPPTVIILRPFSFLFDKHRSLSYDLLAETLSRLLLSPMTSVESVPPFLQAAAPILQPSHLEGDPSLATEILPGPPSLLSVQQSAVRKDTKKPSFALSYLPTSDPGSTYSVLGLAHTPTVVSMAVDGPRRKRPRTSKVCVPLSFHHTLLALTPSCSFAFLIAAAPKVLLCQHSNPESQREPDRRIVQLLSRPQTVTMWRRHGLPFLKTLPPDPLRLLIPTNLWPLGQILCQIWTKLPLRRKFELMEQIDPLPAKTRVRVRRRRRGWKMGTQPKSLSPSRII